MAFLQKSDLLPVIRTYRLDQITDSDDAIIASAIAEAEGVIANFLTGPGYDAASILSQAGTARDQQVVGWARYIALYKLYERIPDEQVPERVVKNYDDTIEDLRRVSDGRMAMNLPRISLPDGTPKTKFRWGSVKKRRD